MEFNDIPVDAPKNATLFMERACAYFEACKGDADAGRFPVPPTISGLALAVGFGSRLAMATVAKDGKNSALAQAIRRAVTYVESGYEAELHSSKCAGAIFALRNLGWNESDSSKAAGSGPTINVLVAGTEALEAHRQNLLRLGNGEVVEVTNG